MIFEEDKSSHQTQYMSFSRYGRTLEKTSFQAAQKEVLVATNIKHGQKYLVQPEQIEKTKPSGSNNIPSQTVRPKSVTSEARKNHANFVFKKVSREAKCYSRHPEFEECFKGKYNPNYDFIRPQSQNIVIRKESKHRSISFHPIQQDEKSNTYTICMKNPLLKWGEYEKLKSKPQEDQKDKDVKDKLNSERENYEGEDSQIKNKEEQLKKEKEQDKLKTFSGLDLHKLEKTASSKLRSKSMCKVWYDKMPKRELLVIPNRGAYEGHLNNFELAKPIDQVHTFESYTGHQFNIKQASNCYDLLKVNYDRLLPQSNKVFLDFQKQNKNVVNRYDRSIHDPIPNTILQYNPIIKEKPKTPNFDKQLGREEQRDFELRRSKTRTDSKHEKQCTVYYDSPNRKATKATKIQYFQD